MFRKILIALCVCTISIGSVGLGLYSAGYMGFEDGHLQFYFGTETPDDPDVPTTTYTIHLSFPDDTVVDYEYDAVNGTFAPTAQNDWVDEQTTSYRFYNWYTDESYHTLYTSTGLRNGITLYAKMIEQIEVRIYAPTADSTISDYQSYMVDKYSLFSVDDYITFTDSCLFGVYSNNTYSTTNNSAFVVSSAKSIYLRWATAQSSFTFTAITGTSNYKISGYTGDLTNILIPSQYYNSAIGAFYNVTTIGASAFQGKSITSAIISNNITSIEDSAFSMCYSLTSVTIPNSVTSLGESVFWECQLLNNIVLPNNITEIKSETFTSCASLTNITLPSSLRSIGDYAFYYCTSLASIVIPSAVAAIGYAAFSNCTSLTSISFPGAVTSIGKNAFNACSSLSEVTLSPNMTTISDFAFGYCTSLESIEIGSNITSIGDYAFWYSGLTEITIPATVTSVGHYTFNNCSNLEEVIILANITAIETSIFSLCTSLKEVILPDSITEIKATAFYQCSSLTGIILPESLITIGEAAFVGCDFLSSVVIPASVQSIEAYAFNCPLVGVTVNGATPPTLGETVFFNTSGYFAIYVSSSNLASYQSSWSDYSGYIYGTTAQDNFTWNIDLTSQTASITGLSTTGAGLTSLIFPSTYVSGGKTYPVNEIGGGPINVFAHNSNLTRVVITPSILNVTAGAFYDCTNLTNVKICSSIEWLQQDLFMGDTSLETVILTDSIKTIGARVFSDCESLTEINLPYSSTTLPANLRLLDIYAFYGCTSLTTITIPAELGAIAERNPFANCTSLTSINVSTDNEYFSSENGILFNKDKTKLICFPAGITGNYNIPSSVTSIGEAAFERSQISSVIIPSSVEILDDLAFFNCSSLVSVTMNEGLVTIDYGAFEGCSLTNITIPSTVTTIESNSLFGNSSLSSIIVKSTIPPTIVSGNLLTNCGGSSTVENVIYVPVESLEAYELAWLNLGNTATYYFRPIETEASMFTWSTNTEDGTATITGLSTAGENANLSSIVTPWKYFDGTTTYRSIGIGSEAFRGNETLQSVCISFIPYSSGETYITNAYVGSYAFYGCTSLTEFRLEDNVNVLYLNDYSFYNCSSLTAVKTYGDFDYNSLYVVGNYAFYGCSSLTDIELLTSLDTGSDLGNFAFYGCSSLSQLGTAEANNSLNVKNIGISAFAYCTSISSIKITTESLGNSAFYNCAGLESVNLYCMIGIGGTNSLTIGQNVFNGCQNLVNLELPEKLTRINSWAFASCSSITSVTIPSTVTEINSYAFEGCDSLTTINVASGNENFSSLDGVLCNFNQTTLLVYPSGKSCTYTIPSNITRIGSTAFSGSNINSVVIPSQVSEIEAYAFAYSLLSEITLSEGLTYIGDRAFYCCSLITVNIPSTVMVINGNAFANNGTLVEINVCSENNNFSSENGVLFNKDRTTLICYPCAKTGLEYRIPSTVTNIKDQAFSHSLLNSIIIPSSIINIESYAFWFCTELASITIESTTPPSLGDYALEITNNCIIYVPLGYVSTYRSATGWEIFYERIQNTPS